MAKAAKPKSAAKPKPDKKKPGRPPKAAAPAAAVAIGPVRQLISQNELKSLLRAVSSLKKQNDEVVGQLREKIAYAVEKKHLHKGAFALFRKLDNLSPESLAEFMDHFDHYYEVGGLEARADSVGRLPLGDQPGEDAEGEDDGDPADETGDGTPKGSEPADGDEKVSRPRFGDRPAA